ncbi:MAG: sensor histidine kinase [Tannerellaceae bacterium]|nr:sensor histidine kinase [Tannerellaceae bacterium]
MDTICFHITDITANSIRAGAKEIALIIVEVGNKFMFTIKDDGCGMTQDKVNLLTDPFYTTRTTRKIGLGIPFLVQNANQTGGAVKIVSVPTQGTTVEASFCTNHIDCPPIGDLADTITLLICGNPEINISLEYRKGEENFMITTATLKEIFEGFPLNKLQVVMLVKEFLAANLY